MVKNSLHIDAVFWCTDLPAGAVYQGKWPADSCRLSQLGDLLGEAWAEVTNDTTKPKGEALGRLKAQRGFSIQEETHRRLVADVIA